MIIEKITYHADSDSFLVSYYANHRHDTVHITCQLHSLIQNESCPNLYTIYGYAINKLSDADTHSAIISSLRNKPGTDDTMYDEMLNQSSCRFHHLESMNQFDMILASHSRSNFLKAFTYKLKNKSPRPCIADDIIIKETINNIAIDYNQFRNRVIQNQLVIPEILSDLLQTMNVCGKIGLESISPMYHHYFDHDLIYQTNISRTIYTKIRDGNILIVNDIEAAEEQSNEIIKNVQFFRPKKIVVFTFLKIH